MITGVGVDIVEKERIERIFLKYGTKFIGKILSIREIKEFNKLKTQRLKIKYLSNIMYVMTEHSSQIGKNYKQNFKIVLKVNLIFIDLKPELKATVYSTLYLMCIRNAWISIRLMNDKKWAIECLELSKEYSEYSNIAIKERLIRILLKRNKLFISRNNKGKSHRRRWIDFLDKNNLKSKGHVSEGWNGIFLEDGIDTVEILPDGRYPSRNDFNLLDFYNDSFCEVVLSSEYDIKRSPYGAFDSEKEWRPFLCCVIPQIVIFNNYDDYLRAEGFDLFDDVLDTSFYKTDDLDKKFEIIKSNLKIIENDLIVDNRFRDDIWLRLKSNQNILFTGWKSYFYKKIDEFKNV